MELYDEKEFLEVCEELGIELIEKTPETPYPMLNGKPLTPDDVKELFSCHN